MRQQTAEQLLQKFSDFVEAGESVGNPRNLLGALTGLPVQTTAALVAHCSESFNSDTVTTDALVKLLLLGAWLASSESKAATA